MALKTLLVMLLLCAWHVPVGAELSLKHYPDLKGSEDFGLFLFGVGEGYSWTNALLRVQRHQEPFFCVPRELALNEKNYMAILDGYISKHDVKDELSEDAPLAFILLKALQEVFPCKEKKDDTRMPSTP